MLNGRLKKLALPDGYEIGPAAISKPVQNALSAVFQWHESWVEENSLPVFPETAIPGERVGERWCFWTNEEVIAGLVDPGYLEAAPRPAPRFNPIFPRRQKDREQRILDSRLEAAPVRLDRLPVATNRFEQYRDCSLPRRPTNGHSLFDDQPR